jgi:hypothetical protein
MSLDISRETEDIILERAREEGISVNDLLAHAFAPEKHTTSESLPTDPVARVRSILAQLQAADNTPRMPPIQTLPGETPTRALFREWEAEAANMTDEEREAEDRLWADVEKSIVDMAAAQRFRVQRVSYTASSSFSHTFANAGSDNRTIEALRMSSECRFDCGN